MGTLDKRAKKVIMSQMADLNEITREEVEALVEPHYIFDAHVARKREIRRKANQLMTQFKDERGVRTCYNYKTSDGQSIYVNVDETKNTDALKRVKAQINTKFDGLHKAKKKVEHRQLELSGQMELFDKEATQ